MQRMEELKAELINDIESVAHILQRMKTKVAQNVVTDINEDGLLTHAQFEYDEYLYIDVEGFKSLLEEDIEEWNRELEETQTESQ